MIILTIEQILTFFLVFSRMSSILIFAPVFSNKEIFSLLKVAIAFWTSCLTIFFIPIPIDFPKSILLFAIAIIIEILIGAIIGFISQIFVTAIGVGGAIMDTQAGLSVASLLDPSTGSQTTIIARMTSLLALLIFLLINGHHIVFSILIQSFRAIPVGSPFNVTKALYFVFEASIHIFSIGLQISAPILLVVFMIDFGFGMLSRVAPQVNVFQLGFQVKPILSLLIFLSIVPGMLEFFYIVIEQVAEDLIKTLFLLRA